MFDIKSLEFWKDKNGNHPRVFSIISIEEAKKGNFKITDLQKISDEKTILHLREPWNYENNEPETVCLTNI